jgi:uncharacterized membrane protein
MLPLFVLLGAFIISLLAIKLFTKKINYSLSGRIAMSVMLLFTAIGHFAFSEGMALMMPDFIPFKKALVYITGVIEICAAIGLVFSRISKLTAWLLIIFFLFILPANINAALKNIDYQTGSNTGPGINYLWFRVPLQVFFIIWTYYFGIYLNKDAKAKTHS